MLILSNAEVSELVDYGEVVAVLEKAYREDWPTSIIERNMIPIASAANLYVMSGYVNSVDLMGCKLVSLHKETPQAGLPLIRGILILQNASNGSVRCVMEAESLTAIRTAACSAIASKYMASPKSHDIGFIGLGEQAKTHLRAFNALFTLDSIEAFDIDEKKTTQFQAYARNLLGRDIRLSGSAKELVESSSILIVATSSQKPVIKGSWLKHGQHIVSIGCTGPEAAEVDEEVIRRTRIVSDNIQIAIHECGDFVIPISQGLQEVSSEWANLNDVVLGKVQARASKEDITLYKSVGSFFQDAVVAGVILEAAEKRGAGVTVPLGGDGT